MTFLRPTSWEALNTGRRDADMNSSRPTGGGETRRGRNGFDCGFDKAQFFAPRAFSSEVDTGSREEKASKQEF
jgi:hypothetical protein